MTLLGATALAAAPGPAGVAGVPVAGLRLRRGRERRQRDPGRHPRLGHHRRALGAGRRGHRRRQPGLPRPPHRDPAAARSRQRAAVPRPRRRRGRLAARPDPRAARPRLRPGPAVTERSCCSRSSPASSSRRSWCSRCTSCSPGTTRPAAGSPAACSPASRSWCATSRAVATSSARPSPSRPARCSARAAARRRLRARRRSLLGGEVLQTAVLEGDVPVLGHVKFVTSLVFDVGVYLDRRRPRARHPAQPRRRARPARRPPRRRRHPSGARDQEVRP